MPKPATPAQTSYLRHLLQQVGGDEPNWATLTDVEASALISGLKSKRGRPVWYGNGQFSHWEKAAAFTAMVPAAKNVAMGEGQTFYLDVKKDRFVHFTLKSRAERILAAGKIMQRPPYEKFGGDAVYAISTTFGKLVPGTQFTHLGAPTPEDPIVAVVFKTNTTPKVGFVEEVVWETDVVLHSPTIVSRIEGARLVANTPGRIGSDDMVMFTREYAPKTHLASRPIPLDKKSLEIFVDHTLVPAVVKWLKRQPADKPIGSATGIASETTWVAPVDSDRTFPVDVLVSAKPSNAKGAAVLAGRAYGKEIEIFINGALTPNDILVPAKWLNRLSPLAECTHETCLPYGLYATLIHEATHIADVYVKKLHYSPREVLERGEAAWGPYINDPGEVRAFMQQIVDEAVRNAGKIRAYTKSNQDLVDKALLLSTTWGIIEKHLNHVNKSRILKAVYTALEKEGLLSSARTAHQPTGTWFHGSRRKYEVLPSRVWSPTGGPDHDVPVFLSPDRSFAELYAHHHGYVYTVKPHVHKTFDSVDLQRDDARWNDDRDEYTEMGKKFYDDLAEGRVFPGLSEDDFVETLKSVLRMDWDTMENGHMVAWLRKNGYDSFYVRGDGPKNLAVLDPKRVEILGVDVIGSPKEASMSERVATRFLRAELLSKQWLMGVRRGWLSLLNPPIHDWDDVFRAFKKLAAFVDNLEEQVKFVRKSVSATFPLTHEDEGKKLDALFKKLKDALYDNSSAARSWYDSAHDRIPFPSPEERARGEQMLALYKTKFGDLLETAVKTKRQPSKGKWNTERGAHLTEVFDKLLEFLRADAKRIEESREVDPDETERIHGEAAFKQFDLYGMKVVIDDRTVNAQQIKKYIRFLDEAYHRLKAKRLERVWYGTVFVRCEDCGGTNPYGAELGVGGNYPIGPDVVNVFVRPGPFVVELMAHELGHRYWFKFMNEGQRGKFESLVHVDSTKDVFARIRKIEGLVKVNTTVIEDAFDSFEREFQDVDPDKQPNVVKGFMENFSAYITGTLREQLTDAFFSEFTPDEIRAYGLTDDKLVDHCSRNFGPAFRRGTIDEWLETGRKLNQDNYDMLMTLLRKKAVEFERQTVAPVSSYGAKSISEAFAEVFMRYVLEQDMNRDQVDSFKAVLKTASHEGEAASPAHLRIKAKYLEAVAARIVVPHGKATPTVCRGSSYTFCGV